MIIIAKSLTNFEFFTCTFFNLNYFETSIKMLQKKISLNDQLILFSLYALFFGHSLTPKHNLLSQFSSSPIIINNITNSYYSILGGCPTILCNGFQYEFWRKKWVWTKHNQFSYALQALKS